MWANVNIWNVLKLKNKSTWMLEAKEWENKTKPKNLEKWPGEM